MLSQTGTPLTLQTNFHLQPKSFLPGVFALGSRPRRAPRPAPSGPGPQRDTLRAPASSGEGVPAPEPPDPPHPQGGSALAESPESPRHQPRGSRAGRPSSRRRLALSSVPLLPGPPRAALAPSRLPGGDGRRGRPPRPSVEVLCLRRRGGYSRGPGPGSSLAPGRIPAAGSRGFRGGSTFA